MTDDELLRQLLTKFAQNRCSQSELTLLLHLLKKSKGDEGMPGLEALREEMPEAFGEQIDADSSERIFRQIVAEDVGVRQRILPSKQKIAASVVLLLLAGLGGYQYHVQKGRLIAETTYGEVRDVVLVDGTHVKLNANTTLRAYKNFNERERREVWIDGEAFFSVSHNAAKPFIVHTERGVVVQVLGTEFNVRSRGDRTQVVLNKGSVKVSLEDEGNTVQDSLKPGEMIVADPWNTKLMKSDADTLYFASWKYNLLAFRGATLDEVARTIEAQYGYDVTFSAPELRKLRFTGSVPSDDLELVLDMIARTFDLQVRKSGERITFKK